jgi:hypothetical protein
VLKRELTFNSVHDLNGSLLEIFAHQQKPLMSAATDVERKRGRILDRKYFLRSTAMLSSKSHFLILGLQI